MDLVPAGISDMAWWHGIGKCISACCIFDDSEISISFNLEEGSGIVANGFLPNGEEYHYSQQIEPETDIRLLHSSVTEALNVLRERKIRFQDKRIVIDYSLSKAKGMGGSSIIAACIISGICGVCSCALSFEELIASVTNAEKTAGIGGGWEDIAGVCCGGIKTVEKSNGCFSVKRVDKNVSDLDFLSDSICVFDSLIPADTSTIINSARENYFTQREYVAFCSAQLQEECAIVEHAIEKKSADEIGRSFLRQRVLWNKITQGVSANQTITNLMQKSDGFVYGYREAGAGGGGTLYVVPKEDKRYDVISFMSNHGYVYRSWRVSDKGVEIN
ncbi:MAG: hypothetical protein KIG25_04280 [Eubacteriales bacterium]|nr:hypothetical protein [Eubacteriales bacterium]